MAVNYQKLWDLLAEKGITRSELRQQTGITTNTMAKMSKNQSVHIEVLTKICDVLGCALDDIISVERDYLNICLSEFTSYTQYQTLGIQEIDDFPMPLSAKSIKELLEYYCASSKLTKEACLELIDALQSYGMRITLSENIIPDLNYIPQTFAQFEDESEENKDIVYQQLDNYIAWIIQNTNISQDAIAETISAMQYNSDEYPQNLLSAIFGQNAVCKCSTDPDEIKQVITGLLNTLRPDEKNWVKLRYEYGITSSKMLQILELPNYETLLWAIEHNKNIRKALMKLRHPKRAKHLRDFIEINTEKYEKRPVPPMPIPPEHREQLVNNLPIEELDLSVRTYNCLKRANISIIADILKLSSTDILQIQNIGPKVIDEIVVKLKNLQIPIDQSVWETFLTARKKIGK